MPKAAYIITMIKAAYMLNTKIHCKKILQIKTGLSMFMSQVRKKRKRTIQIIHGPVKRLYASPENHKGVTQTDILGLGVL